MSDRAIVLTVSGWLKAENVNELREMIDAETAGVVIVLDLADLILADLHAVHYLRDCENDGRIVLRNCPTFIRIWMAGEQNQ